MEKTVHYVMNHAVLRPEKKSIQNMLNSSALFKCHIVNDYWDEEPDLLKTCFVRVKILDEFYYSAVISQKCTIWLPEKRERIHLVLTLKVLDDCQNIA